MFSIYNWSSMCTRTSVVTFMPYIVLMKMRISESQSSWPPQNDDPALYHRLTICKLQCLGQRRRRSPGNITAFIRRSAPAWVTPCWPCDISGTVLMNASLSVINMTDRSTTWTIDRGWSRPVRRCCPETGASSRWGRGFCLFISSCRLGARVHGYKSVLLKQLIVVIALSNETIQTHWVRALSGFFKEKYEAVLWSIWFEQNGNVGLVHL